MMGLWISLYSKRVLLLLFQLKNIPEIKTKYYDFHGDFIFWSDCLLVLPKDDVS